MAHRCRLLETGFNDAYFNMGLDEAVLESVSSGLQPPTLRLYGWKPKAISLGYFQGAKEELDIEACSDHGVDIVRRITGGGAVFHDSELTYSIVIPESHSLAYPSILDSYSLLCMGIIEGLASIGVRSSFAPINDIVHEGKKISGNAQTRKKHCILQHGTILIDVDVEQMFSLLKVPKEKAAGKLIADVKARVTSLAAILGTKPDFGALSKAIAEGFSRALDLELEPDQASNTEIEQAHILAKEKFSSQDWIFRR
jgi:lipoate-protein ligase A